MAIPEPFPAKSLLRRRMREKLRTGCLSPGHACAALDRWLAARPGLQTIAVYSALPDEVDLSESILAHPALVWGYPRISGQHLSFHHGGNFIHGAFGILEPTADSAEIPILEIDAFLCPGLAFSPAGGRLGRGRGFYDRMLARARPDALKLGICFPFQLVTEVFCEPHDVMMDQVLS